MVPPQPGNYCVINGLTGGANFRIEGQERNGLVYLPNQEEPFTGKNLCALCQRENSKTVREMANGHSGLRLARKTYRDITDPTAMANRLGGMRMVRKV